ncbi:hypothetical protein IE53DRAFT_285944 [Violaceomyces palustris]|uniref:Uncharacterized protein n=1 Tax=Violaceomyces palustris TaxID=1673888 RepID=A0ACD0P2X5_9BASI|nr:hypothetical protein IE53DRAFT_285944 [Violaceomyces palustris]
MYGSSHTERVFSIHYLAIWLERRKKERKGRRKKDSLLYQKNQLVGEAVASRGPQLKGARRPEVIPTHQLNHFIVEVVAFSTTRPEEVMNETDSKLDDLIFFFLFLFLFWLAHEDGASHSR